MRRVLVVVEGQSEESFVKDVLAEAFWPRQVYLTPILLGVPGHKGGRPTYARLRKDVITLLKQDAAAYCSTMLDFYRLGADFPGMPIPSNLGNVDKVLRIEQAVKEQICQDVPDLNPEGRFMPYIQLHEYEGLLFSDPAAFARAINKPSVADKLQTVRDSFATPEDINDGSETSPSKRILQIYAAYQKIIEGTLAAREIGIGAMRRECPHFRSWLEQLESSETTGESRKNTGNVLND